MEHKTIVEAFKSNPVGIIVHILLIAGALNWLGVSLMQTNYVAQFTGQYAVHVFTLVGLAGVYALYKFVMWCVESAKAQNA